MARPIPWAWVPALFIAVLVLSVFSRSKPMESLPATSSSRPGRLPEVNGPVMAPAPRTAEIAPSAEAVPAISPRAKAERTLQEELDEREDSERPDADVLVAIQDWDEFYRQASRHQPPDLLRALILRRLAAELSLSEEQVTFLKKLLRAEKEAAAKELLQAYGTGKLKLVLECPREDQGAYREVWTGLSEILAAVHHRTDGSLEATFDAPQRAAINEHLRNENLTLCYAYRRDDFGQNLGHDCFWVVGIGKIQGDRGTSFPGEGYKQMEFLNVRPPLK
jgi:hypothetical protein